MFNSSSLILKKGFVRFVILESQKCLNSNFKSQCLKITVAFFLQCLNFFKSNTFIFFVRPFFLLLAF